MSPVKKICICSMCTALCVVLPPAFHAFSLGTVLSPMHLPVLLCGLLCGWSYGALCGLVGPLLASMINGMPGAAALIYMLPELIAYGLFTGSLMERIHTGRLYPDLYASLIPAMVLGRVVGGGARALFYQATEKSYTLALWAVGYFVETVPAMILQLVLLPLLVLALTRAGLIPARYPRRK